MSENEITQKDIRRLRNPDRIFDLICASNYFAGQFNSNMPVEESRKSFERIKKLLNRRPHA